MPRLLTIVFVVLVAWWIYSRIRGSIHRQQLQQTGDLQLAMITDARSSGTVINGRPNITMTLQYTANDGRKYERTFTRNFNLGQLPRRGDGIKIWVNPNNPSDFDIADKNPIPPGFNA
jgi:hypothetical protein